jgi:aspartate aminotransferase-like enzyme
MTPGPTRVPERVLAAGARPMIHHRTTAFSGELAEMLRLMAPL